MSNQKLEQASQIVGAIPGVIDLLTVGIGGIMELANVIKYDKCEIYIENNHNHEINVVLDAKDKCLLKGWYNIEPYTKSKIYKTERRTYEVGIYAECSECDAIWGCEKEHYIPSDGKPFDIKYDYSFFHKGDKCVKFSYSSDIRKKKEYTFQID